MRYFLIFPLWLAKTLKPINYKTDEEYGDGYYGHWCGVPVYIVSETLVKE